MRILKLFLTATLACCLLLAMSGLAMATDTWEPDATDGFTVTYGDPTAPAEDGQYLLLALGGHYTSATEAVAAINVNNITYIDQDAAENGSVEFSGFWPKTGVQHTLLLASDALTAPILLGWLLDEVSGETPPTGTALLGGVVSCPAAANGSLPVTLKPETGEPTAANTITGGAFYFYAVPGTYTVEIDAPGHLKYTITGVPLTADGLTLPATIQLRGGDFDKDSRINTDDLSALLDLVCADSPASTGNEPFDLNKDNEFNVHDLSAMIGNLSLRDQSVAWEGN